MELLFERLNYLKSFKKFNFLIFIDPNYSEIVEYNKFIRINLDHSITEKINKNT